MTGIFSSRTIAGQVLGEADMVMHLLLDCKLRIQITKLPPPIYNVLGNLELCHINLSNIQEAFPPPMKGKLLPAINLAALKWWLKALTVNYRVKRAF